MAGGKGYTNTNSSSTKVKDYFGNTIWYAVYGVFRKDKCLYVGVTKNAFYREQNHKCRFGKTVEFRIFNWSRSKSRATDLESKYIRQYQKLGQARFNKNGGGRSKAIRLAELASHRKELRSACQFLISQVERLAHIYMSEESDMWIAKNDAINCGKRALSNTVL